MWPIVMGFMRTYAVYITFPAAVVVGFVGYNVESLIRGNKTQPWKKKGIQEERDERKLAELVNSEEDVTHVEKLKYVPEEIFYKNMPPKK